MRLVPWCFFFVQACAHTWAAALVVEVLPGDKNSAYIVALKNTGPGFLHVVGRKTQADSFVTMSFSLRGRYLPSTLGNSDKFAPYLVMEVRLTSGDRMLFIHPPELAKAGMLEASYEDSEFIFSPGQEYLCTIRLPHPPLQVDVRYVDALKRSRVVLARWRAH